MPQRFVCTVCNHPQVVEIHKALLGGASDVGIQRKFHVGRDAVRRHVTGKHPGTEPITGEPDIDSDAPDLSQAHTPRDKIQIVVDWLEKKIQTGRARSDELREYRIAVKDLHSLDQEAEGPKSVTLQDVEGLPELLSAMYEALEPFPLARKALLETLKAKGLEGVLG